MPLKILHVFDHSLPLHSGYSFRSRAILEEQRRLGWSTVHLTSDRQGPTDESSERCDELEFFRSRPIRSWWQRLPGGDAWATVAGLAEPLAALIEQAKPDIVHAHSPCLTALAALRLPPALRKPLVYECRAFWEDAAVDHGTVRAGGARYRLTQALETRVFRRAGAITTICQGLASDIASRGIESDRITVIPNAVDVDRFRLPSGQARDRLRDELGISSSFVVGFIGSFYSYEGLDLLLGAMAHLDSKETKVAVLLVGGGAEEVRLRSLAAGARAPIRFTGRVPQSEIADYYAAMDLLVYPRRSMRLTELVTPLKPLEAMSFRRPLIASDIGGHRELIRHGETGLLFPPGSARAVADAIMVAMADADATERRVAAGREFVERERTWSASVAGYRRAYEQALGRAI